MGIVPRLCVFLSDTHNDSATHNTHDSLQALILRYQILAHFKVKAHKY